MNRSFYALAAVIYIVIGVVGFTLGAMGYWKPQPEVSIFSGAFLIAGVLIFFANKKPPLDS